MMPYESVYTGAFIFEMGLRAKELGLKLDGSFLAMFSQNPGDQVIGDLVHGWGGRSFIVEFKRNERAVCSEFDKPHKKLVLDWLRNSTSQFSVVSNRGHHVGFGQNATTNETGQSYHSLEFLAYRSITNSEKQSGSRLLMGEYMRKLSNPKAGMSSVELKNYIDVLRKASGVVPSGGGIFQALMINVGADGSLRLVSYDLARGHELTLDRGERPAPTRDVRARDRDRDFER